MNTQRYGYLLIALSLVGSVTRAHDPMKSRVTLKPDWTTAQKAGNISLSFQLLDTESNNKVLTDKDLKVVHEKLVHMFVFDSALEVFEHVHPDFKGNRWVITVPLKTNGNYWVWAQGQIPTDDDGEDFASPTRLEIVDGAPVNKVVPLVEKRTGKEGVSVATLSNDKFRAKKMAMPMLTLSRNDGTEPEITKFLGAMAHVVIVTNDGDTLLHVHPMEHGHQHHQPAKPEKEEIPKAAKLQPLMLHTFFPAAGDYRAWVQFVDGGKLKTVALNLKVEK